MMLKFSFICNFLFLSNAAAFLRITKILSKTVLHKNGTSTPFLTKSAIKKNRTTDITNQRICKEIICLVIGLNCFFTYMMASGRAMLASGTKNPLSPSNLLTMKTSVVLPPAGVCQRADVYMRRRWRRIQYLANLFSTRWKREYLLTFQQRAKWNSPKRNLAVGDVVLVKDDSCPRSVWPMGRVVRTESDKNGLVRTDPNLRITQAGSQGCLLAS